MHKQNGNLLCSIRKDKDERQFCGILDVWRKTVKAAKNPVFGLFAIYSGLLVTMIGAVFYRGTKYALYDGLEVQLPTTLFDIYDIFI